MGSTSVSIPGVSNGSIGGQTGRSRDQVQKRALAPRHGGGSLTENAVVDAVKNLPWPELSVPLMVLGIVMAMITPMPAILLDVLISANITLSVIVLLVSMYGSRSHE